MQIFLELPVVQQLSVIQLRCLLECKTFTRETVDD